MTKEYIVWRDDIGEGLERIVYRGKLVRCKDCKYWDGDDDDTFCSELGIFGTDPNSYCSYAKRKETWHRQNG